MKSLKVGVEVMPLIFSKQLNITGIELEEPQITLLRASNGTWNFSSLGQASKSTSPEAAKPGGSQNLSVAKLEIKDGKLSVGTANSTAKPQVYDDLNAKVSNFSFTTQFPFELTVNLPGGGDASLTGKAGPINPQNAAKTPFDAAMKVKDLDLAASGFVDPASGVGGSVDLEGTLNSTGSQAKLAGETKCENLKLSPKGSPAPKAVTVKYAIDEDIDRQGGHHHPGRYSDRQVNRSAHGRISDPGRSDGDESEAQRPGHVGR